MLTCEPNPEQQRFILWLSSFEKSFTSKLIVISGEVGRL